MTEWLNLDDSGEVNVEQIMQQIRTYLAQKRGEEPDAALESLQAVSPALQTALSEARKAAKDTVVAATPHKSSLPVIGPIVDRLRIAAHQLVVFYVNMSAARQAGFNLHALESLTVLSQYAHEQLATKAELDCLRQEVQALRDAFAELEAK